MCLEKISISLIGIAQLHMMPVIAGQIQDNLTSSALDYQNGAVGAQISILPPMLQQDDVPSGI